MGSEASQGKVEYLYASPLAHDSVHQRVVHNMLPRASDDGSPSRTAPEASLTLNKKQSWFGSFKSAVHRGALSAKAAVESLRGSPESMYVHTHPNLPFSRRPLTESKVHRPLIQIIRTFRPSSALHPTSDLLARLRQIPNLPLHLCATISAGTHATPGVEACRTSFARASMRPAFVALMTRRTSSASRKTRERQHLQGPKMEKRAETLRPWSRCRLHQLTYHPHCPS